MSITLITRNDWRVATELINILERANQVRIYNLLEIYMLTFVIPATESSAWEVRSVTKP